MVPATSQHKQRRASSAHLKSPIIRSSATWENFLYSDLGLCFGTFPSGNAYTWEKKTKMARFLYALRQQRLHRS